MMIGQFIAETLLGELIVVIVGVLFAYGIKRQYDRWRYGRWRVRILQEGEEKINRAISPRKAEEILDEPADMSVFLKGVISPYAWIKCDIITEGKKIGLLKIDKEQRQLVVDLDKNPSEENK